MRHDIVLNRLRSEAEVIEVVQNWFSENLRPGNDGWNRIRKAVHGESVEENGITRRVGGLMSRYRAGWISGGQNTSNLTRYPRKGL